MSDYVDPNSMAENAGGVFLSKKKFKELRKDILKLSPLRTIYYNKQFNRISQYLLDGDTQPAIVKSVSPLIVSAYSDEMDAVVLLRFPDALSAKYNLVPGSRLVTSNVYSVRPKMAKDITPGDNYLGNYYNFTPTVQLFLSDKEEYIINRVNMFDEDHWSYVQQLTADKDSSLVRDGFEPVTKFNLLFMIF
ncbi:MAG: hypothetical protein Q4F95_09710 [Oscillospiraceae bacterium]|nr:hypothetical protein [Oscillospiraceae bacterium]